MYPPESLCARFYPIHPYIENSSLFYLIIHASTKYLYTINLKLFYTNYDYGKNYPF